MAEVILRHELLGGADAPFDAPDATFTQLDLPANGDTPLNSAAGTSYFRSHARVDLPCDNGHWAMPVAD
eukprot:3523848-Prymnesium_polylepis.1